MRDRLSPLDAVFLLLEDADAHVSLAIASVTVVAGPVPDQVELAGSLGAWLAATPRARQRLRTVPLDLGQPAWVDDPDFTLDAHLRRVELPSPGDDAALAEQVAVIMAERLPRDRPLWECWVIGGLARGRWAIVLKAHHCMADGMSGMRLYGALFTDRPTDPVAGPTRPDRVVDVVRAAATRPVELVGALIRSLRSPIASTRLLAHSVAGLTALTGSLAPADTSSLSGPIGGGRRYATVTLRLPEAKLVARTFRVTVNDVLLAAISGGLRTLLISRGERPRPGTVRTLVPVSVRLPDGPTDPMATDNQVSLLLPRLPVDLADPVDRLIAVHARLDSAKGHDEPVLSARVRIARHADPAAVRPVVAQANVDVNGRLVRAQVAAESARAAVDLLDDRLRHRLARVVRHQDNRRRTAGQRPHWYDRPVGEREVVRRKSFALSRLTCDAAAEELDALDHDFLVFTELGSGQDSVLYRSGATGLRLAQVSPRTERLARGATVVALDPQRAPVLDTGQAVERLELSGAPFVFYVDRDRHRGSVLYRRFDGHYGVITPVD